MTWWASHSLHLLVGLAPAAGAAVTGGLFHSLVQDPPGNVWVCGVVRSEFREDLPVPAAGPAAARGDLATGCHAVPSLVPLKTGVALRPAWHRTVPPGAVAAAGPAAGEAAHGADQRAAGLAGQEAAAPPPGGLPSLPRCSVLGAGSATWLASLASWPPAYPLVALPFAGRDSPVLPASLSLLQTLHRRLLGTLWGS